MSVFPTGYFNQEENLADRLAGRMNSYQNKKPFRDLSRLETQGKTTLRVTTAHERDRVLQPVGRFVLRGAKERSLEKTTSLFFLESFLGNGDAI